jgi:hypothetical protein
MISNCGHYPVHARSLNKATLYRTESARNFTQPWRNHEREKGAACLEECSTEGKGHMFSLLKVHNPGL